METFSYCDGGCLAKLYLISTPIGNLGDITYRAREVLDQKRVFFTEDTRSFKNLLSKFAIDSTSKQIHSFHDHSDDKKIKNIIDLIKDGTDVCYLSEAGSPIISDPAYPLVVAVLANKIEVESIPGVSSLMVALELSGLPTNPFTFYGFLGRGKEEKIELFKNWAKQTGTKIFFESTNRLIDTLDHLVVQLPNSKIVVARELTKMFETLYRFEAKHYQEIKDSIVLKGEIVVLVYNESSEKENALDRQALSILAQEYLSGNGKKNKILSKIFASILDRSQNEIYASLNSHNNSL